MHAPDALKAKSLRVELLLEPQDIFYADGSPFHAIFFGPTMLRICQTRSGIGKCIRKLSDKLARTLECLCLHSQRSGSVVRPAVFFLQSVLGLSVEATCKCLFGWWPDSMAGLPRNWTNPRPGQVAKDQVDSMFPEVGFWYKSSMFRVFVASAAGKWPEDPMHQRFHRGGRARTRPTPVHLASLWHAAASF